MRNQHVEKKKCKIKATSRALVPNKTPNLLRTVRFVVSAPHRKAKMVHSNSFKSLILRVISAICSIFEVPPSVTVVQHWCCNICHFFLRRFRQQNRPKSVISLKQTNFRATNFRVVNITHLNKLLSCILFVYSRKQQMEKKNSLFFLRELRNLGNLLT